METTTRQMDKEKALIIAQQKISENRIDEAFDLIKELIQEYQDYGPAYNYLGWIYANVFSNFQKACECYELAVKYSPEYPSTYVNYALVLNTIENFDRLKTLLPEALKIPGANKSKLHHEYGVMHELHGDLQKAIESYEEAIKTCLVTQEVERYQSAIYRCRLKSEEGE